MWVCVGGDCRCYCSRGGCAVGVDDDDGEVVINIILMCYKYYFNV